ncbi:flavodoxin [Anaerocolumna cellulosilytica]|uniref:Flavodoxin n=1 Tax=Anaerocolumna cellulosilytica TaxID=433286 RepID=A0A6S6RAD5_9FIRM|nr:flavodoxin family protein [Anaerocolumna cellulosilytica]MBB5195098.1 flavodoxin [Anaerocolumna cellulosilytica]BCJ96065.1 flavodoxin [Anaerocolumna cellulosilytica]
MKAMIVYSTKAGKTEKVAKAMGEQLGITPVNVIYKPIVSDIDVLFVGSGIYYGTVSEEIQLFLDTLRVDAAKKIVLFSTSQIGKDVLVELREELLDKGFAVSNKSFHCKGKFIYFNFGHPNAKDLRNAADFVKEITNG